MQFTPEGTDFHSTSISDLMDYCQSPVDFIQRLKWPNKYANLYNLTYITKNTNPGMVAQLILIALNDHTNNSFYIVLYWLACLNIIRIFFAMSFPFCPLPSSLKFKKIAPPPCHSSNCSDDVMVRTKPVSVPHKNDLNYDATIVPPIDVMVRTKPKIKHHEDNNNPTNHKRKLTQSQRQHIHDSKQIMSQLGHSTTAYKNFSTISIDKKAANASWLELPSISTSPHSYVIIDKTQKPYPPVCIYEITPFDVSSGHSQILKDLIITLMSLSQNLQEIKMNKQLLGGIMKGIGFCPGSDAGKSAGV
ncbi:hypothetical protein O181_063095 [Austropuccinia psidii MF-1]|uniref:Uncharacterized protein n=1 Tax=Austropuccinia psidii MF-1 TaxID=1389203 RepID=A0A9Q3EI70_9BASI|nr:hypothetical protein [Austropuccinia psidii MF-1]